jgi:hypothetical protein
MKPYVFKFSLAAILMGAFGGLGMAWGQTAAGSVHGTVTDPSGAVIPSATVVLSDSNGKPRAILTGKDGSYDFPAVTPGVYVLSVNAKGFAAAEAPDVSIASGKSLIRNFALQLPMENQQVNVVEDDSGVNTSAENNASSIVIKGKDLDALSDDPDELQNELNALAGPAAGPNGGQIYIDGFTGGQLPPKSSIREIRINQNPFAAQYDHLGYGRIEILTKPGTDTLRGSVMMNGNSSAFNSLNPFVTSEPSYYSTFLAGNVSGSAGKHASWFGSVFRRDNASNSIINATLLDADNNSYNYTAAVANPQSRLDVSPRFDLQLGANNTLTVRYMFDWQKETNSGVSQTSLESQAYNVMNHENTLQVSDTQVLSAHTINETRFQYMRQRDNQEAQSTDPTETVQGAFTDGGNNAGVVRSNLDKYELQDYVTTVAGAHSLNFGTRLRYTRNASYSTSGFNGNYIYSSLDQYIAQTPSEYDVTAGNASAKVGVFDAAAFFQDDYKARPNLTLSYGLRYEGQSHITDHNDWAPRFSLAWAPGRSNGPSKTVVRAGYGWFFDRFDSNYILNAIRQNGVNQVQYVVKSPSFFENAPPISELSSLNSSAPTLYSVSPQMKSAVSMQAAIGLERQISKFVTGSATYIYSRGVHQYLTTNVNAYLPGTYDASTGTGTRPNGIDENINQFQSGGVFNQNQLVFNYSVRARRVSLFGFYMVNFAKADTSGATYFPSNQFDPGADYGRASFDVRNRFLLGGNLQAPFGVSISPMLVADSGQPFNITTGEDLNGDNQYNDRPSFATASSTETKATKYGTFDLVPASDATRIPYDYGTGPAQWSLNMRISKSVGIGPRVSRAGQNAVGGPGGPGGPPPGGGGPGGGGPGGGGLGPGGLSSNRGPQRMDQEAPRRYSLNFAVMARNVLNKVNLGTPVSVLSSPMFGESNSLAGGFFSSPAANRSIDLQMSFSF